MSLNIIPKPQSVIEYKGSRALKKDDIIFVKDESFLSETYEIEITKEKAVVKYKTEKGKAYALNTLSQLTDEKGRVPLLKITDFPRFSYRGFMIDSARHMQTIDEIKAYIEAAAMFKFNYFHWHLCDDQGVRFECESYPLLNEVGSYRKGHGFGSENMETYGGFYTKEEIKDVIEFCKERYIEVIPEVDIPGHTVAMLASYPELSCRGEKIEVETTPGIHKDIMCAGKESTYEFCFGVLSEIMELFPCEYIHIGGDEAPKVRWNKCPHCQAKIKEQGLQDAEQLQGYFTQRMVDFVESKGKKAIVWNESLNSGMLPKNVVVGDWLDKTHKSEPFANEGGRIIIEDFFAYYLDYPYGMTPLKKTYNFNPFLKLLNENGQKNVWGVEAPIWTEFVEDFDRMSYMCFPRMMAVAESGWTMWENKDYKSFVSRAENYRARLLSLGIDMARKNKWDPLPHKKLTDLANHYKRFITREMLESLIHPEKED